MKKIIVAITAFILLLHVSSCNTGTGPGNNITSDSATIAAGETSFNQYCSGCHNFRQDAIGPQLSGITTRKSVDWLEHFIKNPQQIISSGDAHAQEVFKKYKVPMPSFDMLNEAQLNGIIAFLNVHKSVTAKVAESKGNALQNPIPEPIKVSNLVVNLRLLTQFPASGDSGKMPLTRITKIGLKPNDANLFVLDLRGKLYKLQNNKPTVYMDMAKLKPKFINQPGLATGFGSFAFHPDFAENGLLYTTHTEPPNSAKADFSYADSIKVTLQWVLTEWKADDPNASTFSGTGRELLRINFVTGIHGVQEITFNPLAKPADEDYGLLYIGVGEGGAVEEGYPFIAHSKENIWGTVLRIDPAGKNSSNGQYGIPPQNPFVRDANSKTLKEIYAYGFRNPHRITWSKAGQMLVSNVGHGNIESLNLILPGLDYGWPIREGSFVVNPYGDLNKIYPLTSNDSIYRITYPVAEYDHDEGKAISGGYEYLGNNIPALQGKFLFGDIPTGRLFYVDMADIKQGRQASIKEWNIAINGKEKTLKVLCGSDRVDLHFGRDAKGELYILTKADGRVYKLIP
ncbi:MAG TPA: PQQ-dependent sugar dehydrogenase [Panacibacter sp.]|nr:PQQ-dependent sugar dehydrogenase [Panacibacter sp.]